MGNNEIKIRPRHFCTIVRKDNYSDLLKIILAVFSNQESQLWSLVLPKKKKNKDKGKEKNEENALTEEDIKKSIINDSAKAGIVIDKIKKKREEKPPCLQDINIFIGIVEKLFVKYDVLTIGIEDKYIDREFRDSYYTHYSEWHLEVARYCKRLVLFFDNLLEKINMHTEGDCENLASNFIGTIVIRPVKNAAIGRSLLNPSCGLCIGYVRTGEYKITYRGLELKTDAFPFSMQDRTTTTCAEITLLNLLDYYSNQYSDYQFLLPSQISNTVKQIHFDRVLPTLGLSYQNISKVLYRTGFTPKMYWAKDNETLAYNSPSDTRRFLSYYMESGIPVAIGLKRDSLKQHSVVCIGHGICDKQFTDHKKGKIWKGDEKRYYCASFYSYSQFIVQDDTQIPYSIMTEVEPERFCFEDEKSVCTIECLAAPLYKKMYMDAQRAEATIKIIFDSNRLSPAACCTRMKIADSQDNPLIYRLFLASSRHFKQSRVKNIKNQWLKVLYAEVALPQFIWVCELYDKVGYEKDMAFGEIVLDATHSGTINMLDSCLMINYPDRHMAKDQWDNSLFDVLDENKEDIEGFDIIHYDIDDIYIYPSYSSNLNNGKKKLTL